mgnify:CR=1 FL=1
MAHEFMIKEKLKCAWCSSELVELEQEALKKESQHLCLSCCQSDDEYYGTNKHLITI